MCNTQHTEAEINDDDDHCSRNEAHEAAAAEVCAAEAYKNL